MSKATFTLGPWFVLAAADGETYISTSNAMADPAIALIGGHEDEDDANALLIAAAPALYEALNRLMEGAVLSSSHDPASHTAESCNFCFASAVLAKARGES